MGTSPTLQVNCFHGDYFFPDEGKLIEGLCMRLVDSKSSPIKRFAEKRFTCD